MSLLGTLVPVAVAVWVGGQVVVAVRSPRTREAWAEVVGAVRWWMLPVMVLELVATTSVLALLWRAPALRWGWWSMLGGDGNAMLVKGEGIPSLVTIGVLLVVLALAPLLALAEELAFREGSQSHGPVRVVLTCLAFGGIHVVVGVPLAAAGALAVLGLVLHLVYRVTFGRSVRSSPGRVARATREATLTAAAAHTVHNWIVLALALFMLVVTMTG